MGYWNLFQDNVWIDLNYRTNLVSFLMNINCNLTIFSLTTFRIVVFCFTSKTLVRDGYGVRLQFRFWLCSITWLNWIKQPLVVTVVDLIFAVSLSNSFIILHKYWLDDWISLLCHICMYQTSTSVGKNESVSYSAYIPNIIWLGSNVVFLTIWHDFKKS